MLSVIRYQKRFPLETQFERIYLSTLWLLHVKWPLVKCTLPVRWIIIDISQNGFSINWTPRSSTPFTQGPRGKGVGLGGVYFLRGWSTMRVWQFLTLVSIASSIRKKNKFEEIVWSWRLPDRSRALILEFFFATTVVQQFGFLGEQFRRN